MKDKAYRWIIPILMGIILAVTGWSNNQSNQRVTRMERLLDELIPTTYIIKEKVENIERILKKPVSP